MYIEYHIPRIKSDEELRTCSTGTKRPGEKWDVTGHLHYMLPTNPYRLPIKPELVTTTLEEGALDLGAIPEHWPWGK